MRGRLRALLVGVLLAALTFEVLLRLLTCFPWSTPEFVADDVTGFRQRAATVIGGELTNSRGFNDVEPAAVKTGRRLGVVGDSFVFSVVPRAENFVSRLAAGAGGELEVLNLAILAAGPENYLGVLEKDGALLEIDAALVVFFIGNDISQADPHFKTRVLMGSPRAVLASPWQIRPHLDYIYSVKLLRGAWRLARERWLPRAEPGGTFSRQIFLEIERDRLEMCRREPNAAVARGYAGAAAFFDRLRRFEEERGIAVAVVLAPDQYQVDADLQAALLGPGEAELFDLELPQRQLGRALEERGLRYLDLLPELRRRAAAEILYEERDTHWNRGGNREVGDLLLAALRSWGWLDSRASEH